MTVDDIVAAYSDPCGLSLECSTSEQFLTLGVNQSQLGFLCHCTVGESWCQSSPDLPAFIPSFHNMNSSRKTYQWGCYYANLQIP